MKQLRFLPLTLLLGCAETRDVEGLYAEGFELMAFTPCTQPRPLWWTDDSDLSRQYHGVAARGYEPVFVRLKGVLSDSGAYGHMGGATYSFDVTEIKEIRQRRPGECVTLLDSLRQYMGDTLAP